MAAPTPAPAALISVSGTTVTATRSNAAESGATAKLLRRTSGTTNAWTVADTDASPAAGTVLTDAGVSVGTYEYEVADFNAGGEQTVKGSRWCGVVIQSSTWDTILAAVRAKLVAQGVSTDDIYDGEMPEVNHANAVYVLRPKPESVVSRANGDFVTRNYPVQIEYRIVLNEFEGSTRMQSVRDAQDTIIAVFDGATPSDIPSLSGLERITVDVTSKSDYVSDEYGDDTIAVLSLNVPIWETR